MKSKIPALILALGAIIRAASYTSAALWYDESVTLYRTTALPFFQTYVNRTDNSGCLLLEMILRPLMLISHSLWLLRLPSLVASFVALWLVWKIMQSLQFSLRQQILASLFVAFLPGLLWISQDARAYSLLSAVILAGIYFAIEGRTLGMAACMGLMIYCHNTGPASAAAVLLIGLYFYPWKARRMVLAGLAAALAWVPGCYHIVTMSMPVFGILQPWQPRLTLNWFTNSALQALWVSCSSVFVFIGFLVCVASLGLLYHKAWKNRQRNSLLIAWIVPICVLAVASAVFSNVISYRILHPMLFAIALWLGWEFGQPIPGKYRLVMAALWLGLLAFGFLTWRPADRGGHLDQAADYIRSQWRTGDVIVYETQTVARPFLYYLSDLPHYAWPYISDLLMNEPGMPHADTADPALATRTWLVIPGDALITPAEQAAFDLAYPHSGEPLWQVHYLQAAPMDIYLMDR